MPLTLGPAATMLAASSFSTKPPPFAYLRKLVCSRRREVALHLVAKVPELTPLRLSLLTAQHPASHGSFGSPTGLLRALS